MNTLTALLAFASHSAVNATADGGLKEPTKLCIMTKAT